MESIPKIELKYLPMRKVSIYEVMNMPTMIGEFSINYKMTTPKIRHDVTTPTKTWFHLSLVISFTLLYLLKIFHAKFSTFTETKTKVLIALLKNSL